MLTLKLKVLIPQVMWYIILLRLNISVFLIYTDIWNNLWGLQWWLCDKDSAM